NRDDQITLKNHYEQNLKNCNRTKLEIENLIREINNKVGELKSCLENGLKLFEELEINKIDILNINFSENILRTKIAELDIKINEYIALLDEA
ncbi:hypothetical protein ABTN04_18835, partial [Acinetobacter baumannii]